MIYSEGGNIAITSEGTDFWKVTTCISGDSDSVFDGEVTGP